MKILFFSLLLGGFFSGVANAQFGAGADAFNSAPLIPAEGGYSLVTNLNVCTLQPGEVLASDSMLPKTAWWRWTASEDGFCVVETVMGGLSFGDDARRSSELGIFTGDVITGLTKVAQGAPYLANVYGGKLGSATRFYAQKGRTYSIQVGASYLAADYRNIVLNLAPLPAQSLSREAVWTYTTEAGVLDVAALTMMQNISGTITGKLRLRSGTYPFSGILDHAGVMTVAVTEKQKKGASPRSPIILTLAGFKDSSLMAIHPSGVAASAYVYDALPQDPLPVENWTGAITSGGDAAVGPVTMKVSASQRVSVALRFLDGTAGTHSGRVMGSSQGPGPRGLAMMKILSGGKFAFQASGSFFVAGSVRFTGSGRYIRQEKPGASFYPAGISTFMSLNAYPFTKPAAGQRALGFLNATEGVGKLRVTDPNNELGGDVDLPLTLDANNKFVFAVDAVRKPTLKLNVTTGQVTGTVILGGKKRNILGAIYNGANPTLQGYITGAGENVKFEVIP